MLSSAYVDEELLSQLGPDLWVWGVDPSSTSLALACRRPGRTTWATKPITKTKTIESRIGYCYDSGYQLAHEMYQNFPPICIGIETPPAHLRATRLTLAIGAIVAGLSNGIHQSQPDPPFIHLVNVATWKKLVLGNGHADKDDSVRYASVVRNYDAQDDNIADAICIADATALALLR